MPATTRDDALARVYQDARAAGLDDEGARVAAAIALTEDGYTGKLGDNGVSAGTFQLHHGGGQGTNYAASQGLTPAQSIARLRADPHAANRWALSGYLGQAIREGQRRGLHGADLATYAQREGQRSVSPERSGSNFQLVSDDVGGGVTMAQNAPAVSPSQRIFDQVVAAKGDPVGIAAVDPEVESEQPETNFLGDPTGKTVKTKTTNPAPVYRYTFADGTHLDARTTRAGDLELRGGTALTSMARSGGGAGGSVIGGNTANEQFIVTVMPDGSIRQSPNPNYVPPKAPSPSTVATNTTEPYIVTRDPDGSLRQEPNPNYVKKPGTTTHVAGGRAYTVDDATGKIVSTQDLRTPEEVAKGQIDLAQAGVDLAKSQRELLPKQQQILQGHADTVKFLQGMYERKEIDLPQMDAYVAASLAAAKAAMRGTTPFDEMKEQRTAEQARQKMGVDLLNQRLTSGAGLASSLLSSATSLAGHAMLRPGQTTLGVDPFANLLPILTELQGGPDVTPFARGLLMGGQQPPPGAPPALAGL